MSKPLRVGLDTLLVVVGAFTVWASLVLGVQVLTSSSGPSVWWVLAAAFVVGAPLLVITVVGRRPALLRWYPVLVLAACALNGYLVFSSDNQLPWSLLGPMSWALIAVGFLLTGRPRDGEHDHDHA